MPSWDSIFTFSSGFLVGALTGAAGQYLADRFTDQRRSRDSKRASTRALRLLEDEIPDLFKALRADVIDDPTVRLCVVVPSPGVKFHAGDAYFAYAETEIPNVRNKFLILANRGHVDERLGYDLPLFVLTEDFVTALKSSGRKGGE